MRAHLDTQGLACPLPVLLAQKRLRAMVVGDRLSVTATDPLARIDLAHFCTKEGHGLISVREEHGVLFFEIEKRC